MRRRSVPFAVGALLVVGALAVTGCGQSQKDKYSDGYKPLNDRLLRIGEAIGTAPLEAGPQSKARLAERFRTYASDLGDVNRDIGALDAPSDLEDESKMLTSSIDVVVGDLGRISTAAKRGDRKAAAAAARALTEHEQQVNLAQNALAGATGADIGPR